jgi:hypothetical protein
MLHWTDNRTITWTYRVPLLLIKGSQLALTDHIDLKFSFNSVRVSDSRCFLYSFEGSRIKLLIRLSVNYARRGDCLYRLTA